MTLDPSESVSEINALPASARREILHSLAAIASCAANIQLDAFAARLANALFAYAEQGGSVKDADLSFNAANLLKQNTYAFHYLASTRLEEVLRQEIRSAENRSGGDQHEKSDEAWSLVPYAEMDNKVLLANIGRPLEVENGDQLAALGRRISCLLERDDMSAAQNPFRPEVFLQAINETWREFSPEAETHHLILPLLQPDVFLELAPILKAINDALISRGIQPELDASYRIRKSNTNQNSARSEGSADSALSQQLRQLLSGNDGGSGSAAGPAAGTPHPGIQCQLPQAAAATKQLLGYLAGMQKNSSSQPVAEGAAVGQQSAALWANIKKQAPNGTLTRVDENTIDVMTKIFEVVFNDQNIPNEIKALIGFLQVPVLKAALIDKDFFFEEAHPARRLIDTLTKSGVAWDQKKGRDDPLYQTMKRAVERVQDEFDQQISVFSDVVTDVETFINEDDAAATGALSTPITKALQQEKLGHAKKTAKVEVSHRVGTGEVVAFVETFLEHKWVSVLTIAYSLKDEKPEAVQSAIKTMDDLIWSVKPKITLDQRKQLIAKLPSILAGLNQWLNVVKWDDADRLRFFAELAECHASIVRAPLAMSPERRLEIALEVAKKATERRLQKRANIQPEPVPDEFDTQVEHLTRGAWLDLTSRNGVARKVKLAWVSPMRSLYIFTTRGKDETFSVSAEEMAQVFREKRAKTVALGGLVDRALAQAVQSLGANDAVLAQKSAA